MQRRAFSRGELIFLIGVPLAWAVLLLFHPGGEGEDVYADLHDDVTRFLVVHVGMMLFIPLMGVAVYLLVRGLDGTAALVSRIGSCSSSSSTPSGRGCTGSAAASSPTR